jgi:molybdate transport system substrate-binding protein
VMVTPKGNPAGIERIEDMAKPEVRVALAPDASSHRGAEGRSV